MTCRYAVAAALLMTPTMAPAQELREIQNYSVHLGTVSGSVFFEMVGGDPRLVATLSGGPDATPIRVVTSLLVGQSTLVSVPQGPGEQALDLIFTRSGDRVLVQDRTSVVSSIR